MQIFCHCKYAVLADPSFKADWVTKNVKYFSNIYIQLTGHGDRSYILLLSVLGLFEGRVRIKDKLSEYICKFNFSCKLYLVCSEQKLFFTVDHKWISNCKNHSLHVQGFGSQKSRLAFYHIYDLYNFSPDNTCCCVMGVKCPCWPTTKWPLHTQKESNHKIS